MRVGLKAIAALLGGSLAGIAAAHMAMEGAGSAEGPWRPRDGGPDGGPYALARQMLTGRLASPAPALAEYEFTRDEDGAFLDADCAYRVEGRVPGALWWSLAATDDEGQARARASALTAHGALLEPDGTVRVWVSGEPQPGNWIAPKGTGSFLLRLRVLSPVRTGASPRTPDLGVTKAVCR